MSILIAILVQFPLESCVWYEMGRKPPRKFDIEFKRQAVSLVLEEGFTQSEVAKRLDISPTIIGRWVKDFQQDGTNAFPVKAASP